MKYYEDFIGVHLQVNMTPSSLFNYPNEREVLKEELWKRIKAELTYRNGLICSFGNRKVYADGVNNLVIVEGTVTRCEVDC